MAEKSRMSEIFLPLFATQMRIADKLQKWDAYTALNKTLFQPKWRILNEKPIPKTIARMLDIGQCKI